MIVLTGPPGAGKTTVAELLAGQLEPSVHLRGDDFWHFIKRGYIAPDLPASHRQNEVVERVLATAAFGYAVGGYQVICDGIVGPWFLGRRSRRARGARARHHRPRRTSDGCAGPAWPGRGQLAAAGQLTRSGRVYSLWSALSSVVLGITVSSGVGMCRTGTGSGRLRTRLSMAMALKWYASSSAMKSGSA